MSKSRAEEQLKIAIKSLTTQRESEIRAWKMGIKTTKAKWPDTASISTHYNKLIYEKQAAFDAQQLAFNQDKSSVIESSSVKPELPTERALDMTPDDRSVVYHVPAGQTAELRNWQQRAANGMFERLFEMP